MQKGLEVIYIQHWIHISCIKYFPFLVVVNYIKIIIDWVKWFNQNDLLSDVQWFIYLPHLQSTTFSKDFVIHMIKYSNNMQLKYTIKIFTQEHSESTCCSLWFFPREYPRGKLKPTSQLITLLFSINQQSYMRMNSYWLIKEFKTDCIDFSPVFTEIFLYFSSELN